MDKILIIGGTGFVGLNAARTFAAEGVKVVVTSRRRHDAAGEALAAENPLISVAYLDLQSHAEVFDLFTRHHFDGMVMLAHAHQYARTRAASNAIYPITLNCLEGARCTGVKRLVLASSRAIYGGLNPPYHEDRTFPANVSYAGTIEEELGLPHIPEFETTVKRTVEMIAFDYAIPMPAATSGLSGPQEERAMEVVALRFPIQWGPGYTAMGSPFSLLAHTAAGRIDSLNGRTGYLGLPVTDFWGLLSGSSSSFVQDSASAILTTMLADALPHPVYNVCSGFNNKARDQLEALYRVLPEASDKIGIDPTQLDHEPRPDDGFNGQRLRDDFGWRPTHSSIDGAWDEYVSWLRLNPF
ncbi:MAG: NAD(P)-dependent oxidoreductase [Pseudomonadota bacterium]